MFEDSELTRTETLTELPEGVGVCEGCRELYTEELTTSECCESCDFYLMLFSDEEHPDF